MIPKSLELHNFKQHRHRLLDYQAGVTGITGRNGVGKTNLITEGQYFAITGKTIPEVVKADLVSWSGAPGRTVFKFEHEGVDWTLTRWLGASRVRLESEHEKLTGSKANVMMEKIIGLPLDVFYEACWAPQGGLRHILTCAHSKRLAFFQKMAGAREAENIRGMLQEGINSMPLHVDRAADIEKLDNEIQKLFEATHKTAMADIQYGNMVKEFEKEVDRVKEVLKLPSKREHDEAESAANDAYVLAQFELDQFEKEFNGRTLPEEPPQITQGMLSTSTALKALKEVKDELAVTGYQLDKNAQHQRELEEGSADAAILEAMRDRVATMNTRLIKDTPKYKMYSAGVCPTCQREYGADDEDRKAFVLDYEGRDLEFKTLQEGYRKMALNQEEHQKRVDLALREEQRLKTEMEVLERKRDSAQAVLDKYPTEHIDLEGLKARQAERDAYQQAMKEIHTNERKRLELQNTLDAATKALEEAKSAKHVSDQEKAEGAQFLETFEELKTKSKNLSVKLGELNATSKAKKEQRQQMKGEQETRAKTLAVTGLFSRARDELHRERLPKLRMQRLLYQMNKLLGSYLSLFDVSFTAYLSNDFDFLCTFDNKEDASARALSGGQQVALAVAFYFALSDLMASSVPILVLDEPTEFLDADNKKRIAEVFKKAKAVAEQGIFVMVSTHEESLMPSFSRTVEIT
jgi:DNA repair exonuclease SbcCD ATPase subunit